MVATCILVLFFFPCVGSSVTEREYICAVVCMIIPAIPALIRLGRSLMLHAATMVCPNCGSTQVRITSRIEGTTENSSSQFKRSFIAPRHYARVDRKGQSQINRQRVAVCQSCGFDYPYLTATEIQKERKIAITTLIVVLVIMSLGFLMGLFVS